MIRGINLSAFIGKKRILKDLTFEIPNGTITAVIGRNGSGKTTLLRTAAGRISRTEGDLLYDGKMIRSFSEKELSRIVSYMPQFLPDPAISVKTLVEYGRVPFAGFSGKLTAEDVKKAENALEISGMKDFSDKLICHISGGERQMAYAAMAMAQNCPVMLMDEPFSGLDVSRQKQLTRMLRLRKEQGHCVILSLHDLEQAVELADQLIVMQNGSIVFAGCREEFLSGEICESVFEKRPISVTDENGNRFTVFRDI